LAFGWRLDRMNASFYGIVQSGGAPALPIFATNVNSISGWYATGATLTLDGSGNVTLDDYTMANGIAIHDGFAYGGTASPSVTTHASNTIDFSVSGGSGPSSIDCTGRNYVYNIDTHGNSNLTSLTLTGCSNLQTLDCHNCSLTSLDLTALSNLTTLDCSGNSITGLDLSSCSSIATVLCNSTNISSINITGLIQLRFLDIHSSSLSAAAVDGIFAALVANGYVGGYVDTTSNAAPTAAGLADIATLISNGWTCAYDP
jgi:Leucine Rich repeats (2 copies)